MKKRFLVFLMMIVAISMVSADGLNKHAQGLKDNDPTVYEIIKNRAVEAWSNDHQMVLYQINLQSDSLIGVAQKQDRIEPELLWSIFVRWCDDDLYYYDNIMDAPIDWQMVEYEIDLQLQAKGKY